jgi:hypothetical protein
VISVRKLKISKILDMEAGEAVAMQQY